MKDWTIISGLEANRIAEVQRIAQPGTFNAVVFAWNGGSQPPSSVAVKGRLRCLGCSQSTPFEIKSMSGEVRCSGCSTTFSLFKDDCQMDGGVGFVMIASVFSRAVGQRAAAPVIEVTEVLPT